ncbi:MAG: glycosyltransferase family 4 protein [Bacteroidetes Order II. Incertae sedis bacterium]|nr:glycosyltransferase family 4 protein [Bacteroidetes Order II. bacterium]
MRIGLNLIALRSTHGAGVERFARNVVGSMRLGDDQSLWIGIRAGAKLTNLLGEQFLNANIVATVSKWHSWGTTSRLLIEMIFVCWKTYSLDVVLSVNNFGPLLGKSGQRKVVVIHDVWFLDSGFDGSGIKKWLFGALIRIQLLSTTHIITVSEFSKKAIVRHLNVDEKIVSVVPNCVPPGLITIDDSLEGNRQKKVTDSAVPHEYFLMVGSDRPNKNIWRGVQGYLKFVKTKANPPFLYIVGHYTDNYKTKLKSVVPQELAESVIMRGFVSDNEYRQLIKGCIGLVFPSLYEGFGIPIVEAMVLGKQILVSRGTVCEEIAGEFGIPIDAKDEYQISLGLSQLFDRRSPDMTKIRSRHLSRYQDCPCAGRDLLKALLVNG